MRKAQKQDILNMIQTLHEAHEEIKSYIDRKSYALAQDILSQCQECAISIGTAIEKFEGEGFATVSFVETYCDVVFACYEELNGTDANANKIYKNLKKQLLRIENSVKNDVPVRKEITFFPYKASMWDALESVYLAAKEDPDCDAYCVPIPYYDRNPDGSLAAMHYEGLEYPKNIEVIDWQTYNFEERKPDAIYIHNPYDDWNLVTCVHPRYFSNNLKKYTDKLVYIPYFILGEIEPDDQKSIDNMKHFIWTPGVINADQVIVQSEKMKQIYVNEYLKAAQTNGLQGKHIDRKYLEEKFLGLGSPKIDKVLNTKKEDLEIPEDWLKIIEKSDGSRKKIIFYNTSIAALLQNNEKMLEKMKDVFRIFKENKDGVALLWRPHPLIKSTVSAMRPQLWAEYEKLVNWYRQEGWGIYDDTADMDRAVVLSDAYYGDASSVVQVYQQTGKLVMIQDVDADYIRMPFFYDWVWNEEEIFYPLANGNALCKSSINSGKTEIIATAPNEKGRLLFAGIYKYGDCLLLSSINAKAALHFYNLKTSQWSHIPVEKEKKKWLNFRENSIFEYENFLYIFPFDMVILKVDVKHRELNYLYYPDMSPNDDIRGEVVCVNHKIYISMKHSNKIVCFDMDNEKIEVLNTNVELEGIDTLCFDGKLFWMTGIGKMICSWDENTGESVSYYDFPKGFQKFTERAGEKGYWFSSSFKYNNSVFFVPSYANMLIELDLKSGKMEQVYIPDEEENEVSIKRRGRYFINKYGMAKQKNNRLMMLSSKNKRLIFVDLDTKECETIELHLENDLSVLDNAEDVIKEENVDISSLIRTLEIQTGLIRKSGMKVAGQEIHMHLND